MKTKQQLPWWLRVLLIVPVLGTLTIYYIANTYEQWDLAEWDQWAVAVAWIIQLMWYVMFFVVTIQFMLL